MPALIFVDTAYGASWILGKALRKGITHKARGLLSAPERKPTETGNGDSKMFGQERGTGALIEHEKGGTKARLSPFPLQFFSGQLLSPFSQDSCDRGD